MTEKCKSHPEQEVIIIKFCPCCHEEFRMVSTGRVARDLFPIEPLPQDVLPIYEDLETTAEVLKGDDDAS